MNEKVDYLLDLCVGQQKHIDALNEALTIASQETGMEGKRSVLGEPEYHQTINKLLKQIDKQAKWLDARRDEVSVLQNALKEKGDSRKKHILKTQEQLKMIELLIAFIKQTPESDVKISDSFINSLIEDYCKDNEEVKWEQHLKYDVNVPF